MLRHLGAIHLANRPILGTPALGSGNASTGSTGMSGAMTATLSDSLFPKNSFLRISTVPLAPDEAKPCKIQYLLGHHIVLLLITHQDIRHRTTVSSLESVAYFASISCQSTETSTRLADVHVLYPQDSLFLSGDADYQVKAGFDLGIRHRACTLQIPSSVREVGCLN